MRQAGSGGGFGGRVGVVVSPVFDVGQLAGASPLSPALGEPVVIEHERRVRAVTRDALPLDRLPIQSGSWCLWMPADAPATPEDSAVTLDEFSARRPRRGVELPDSERHRVFPTAAWWSVGP
jgi:hypothetical protein